MNSQNVVYPHSGRLVHNDKGTDIATIRVNLTNIRLRERGQTQKMTPYDSVYVNSSGKPSLEMSRRLVVTWDGGRNRDSLWA